MAVIAVLTVLATHYLTYVLTRSDFPPVLRAREFVLDRYGDGSWQLYLVTCSFCTGFYIAAIVTLLVDLIHGVPVPVLLWFAAASGGGTLIEVVDTLRAVAYRSSRA